LQLASQAVDANNTTDDPFRKLVTEMEPLHAIDAAQRLMGNDPAVEEMEAAPFAVLNGTADEEMTSPMLVDDMNSGADDGNESRSTLANSLFERIQLQKNQQGTPLQPNQRSNTQYNPVNSTAQPSEGPFGHPMTEDVNYSYSEQPSSQEFMQIKVPQYSSSPRLDPYDTGATGATDYKSKMMGVLSSVGSVANTAARGAVSGTKQIYSNIANMNNNNSTVASNSGGMVNEMDYQRRSLLMDPHDLEDRVVPVSAPPPSVAPKPVGMIGGLEEGSNADLVRNQGYSMVGYAHQFVVDVKDLFLAAPPYVKVLVVGLFVLISWLLFF